MASRKQRQRPAASDRKPATSSPAAPSRVGWIVGGVIAVGVVMALLLKSGPKPVEPAANSPKASVGQTEEKAVLEDEKAVFATYAGSTSCRECHAWEYDTWKKSHHGLAERSWDSALDRAAFDPAHTFKHGSQTSEARLDAQKAEVVTLGFGGKREAYPVERVIGEDPLRQFLVKRDGGRLQTLEVAWDPNRKEWFNVYGGEDRQPGEWGHWTGRGMNWNNMCATCHNTRPRKNYDAPTDSYHTAMAEVSVSCESCHGPMRDHVSWQKSYAGSGKLDPTLGKLTKDQMFDTCGSCHSRRMELTGDFKPGDKYHDQFILSIPDESNIFHPDGQIWDEDYEFTAFLGSRMHHAGVRCWDCHEPHSSKLVLPKENNLLCMRCHNGGYPNSPIIDPVAHSFHKSDSTGNQCVNCHMPQTTYMQRHARRDHGFTIPDPLITKQHGIPNACNRCHTDKDTEWALAATEKWWGAKMNRRTRVRAQTLASAKEGVESAKNGLVGLLTSDETPFWKAVSANMLERWSQEPVVANTLLQMLNHTNSLVRANAAHSLGPWAGQGNRTVDGALRNLLNDEARSVRYIAAWAMRRSLDLNSKAGKELVRTLDYNQDQPVGQLQKGVLHLTRNEVSQALPYFERAVSWDSRSADIRQEYATVLSMAGRSQDALVQIQEACKLAPNNAEHRYRLGLAFAEVGDLSQAMKALEETVRLDPRNARAWYNLGLSRNQLGDANGALDALTRAESADATSSDYPYARATILSQLRRIGEAMTAAQRALEISPGHSGAQQLLRSLSSGQ